MIPKCNLCGCHLYTFDVARARTDVIGVVQVTACRLCDGGLVDRLTAALDASELRRTEEP